MKHILDVNENEDKCVFHVEGLLPQTVQMEVPYSLLEEEMHLAGLHLYLNQEKAKQKALATT